jgi:hypothetical protein
LRWGAVAVVAGASLIWLSTRLSPRSRGAHAAGGGRR